VDIRGSKVLVLGGYGLVGTAVCRQLLTRRPREIQIHSLRESEAEQARSDLAREPAEVLLSVSHGDLFGLRDGADDGAAVDPRATLEAYLRGLSEVDLDRFLLYDLLVRSKPDVVIDCINTATAIAYRDLFRSAETVFDRLGGHGAPSDAVEHLLGALYVPRLIRHIQVLYRGMVEAGTRVYVKVGTSGTGGMGLNIPYTHSEGRPSRQLLAKSALAGAQSMLLFLMARTPGAPITKEIKPAAAIAWKKIAHGPIYRRGVPIRRIEAEPRKLGSHFSTENLDAAAVTDEILEAAYIDTGENGIFSLEEFAALTTAEQMEFVTPEEIAHDLIFEIEGGNTGHDVINALDNAVLGPSYRAGLMRHWALERMNRLQKEHGTHSVAFEMLGPPRITKLLFEAHLLQQTFGTMNAVRERSPEEVAQRLDEMVRERPEMANDVAAVGIPLLLRSGEVIRGPRVIVPDDAREVEVTPELLESWVRDGWVDLRPASCARWIDRFHRIHREVEGIPEDDTSSRHLRNQDFWDEGRVIQPGKVVGWILSEEEHGARMKG
jgi:hypothetical protein